MSTPFIGQREVYIFHIDLQIARFFFKTGINR